LLRIGVHVDHVERAPRPADAIDLIQDLPGEVGHTGEHHPSTAVGVLDGGVSRAQQGYVA
jgi:hypothetical protein